MIDPEKAHLQKNAWPRTRTDQDWLREQLGFMGLPTLFKQYADVCTTGGVILWFQC